MKLVERPKAVFWDIDGTLITTEGLHFEVIRDWCAGHGYLLTEEANIELLGKTMPEIILGFVNMIFVTLISVFWFDIPVRGSIITLFVANGFYLMTSIGIGLIISTLSETQQQAMMSTFFFYLPAVLLSGFMFPIANMPEVVQAVTYLNPLRYFLVIIRGIFLKGVGVAILWPQIMALLILGILVLTLAVKKFRKNLA